MHRIKVVNRIAVFVIELIMIGIFAYAGFQKGNDMLARYCFAFMLPVIVVVLWGYFAAPKSFHRLRMPYLAMFRLTLFLTAAYLLYQSGQIHFAIALTLLSVCTQVTGCFVND